MPSHFLSNFKFSDNSENSVIHRQISTLWISCGLWITLWITFCRMVSKSFSWHFILADPQRPAKSGRMSTPNFSVKNWQIFHNVEISRNWDWLSTERASQSKMIIIATENDYQLGRHARVCCTNWEWVSTNNKLSENLNF